MIDREEIASVLENDIRPSLQSHGGDCELVDVTDEGTVKVALQGACRGCPMAQMTIRRGVESKLKEAIPEVKEVV
ncbi:MAG: NifU family protein, partial [Planctomycetota bacterium]